MTLEGKCIQKGGVREVATCTIVFFVKLLVDGDDQIAIQAKKMVVHKIF